MATNRLSIATTNDNALGEYLKDRRAKLDPADFGFSVRRRRTPGLRREEVAQRAGVSATWYTWLEQGRGGTPSAEVLDGIANALALSAAEREYLFLLAQHRPPQAQYQSPDEVSPQLQKVLDAMHDCPAYVKTPEWEIVAWNKAAARVLFDYGTLPLGGRNLLRNFFLNPCSRLRSEDWESHARFAVAAFRADIARAGATENVRVLVDELSESSPEFAALWSDQEVGNYGEGTKQIRNSTVGLITLDYSTFSVDGRPDLSLVIFTPSTPDDEVRVRQLNGINE